MELKTKAGKCLQTTIGSWRLPKALFILSPRSADCARTSSNGRGVYTCRICRCTYYSLKRQGATRSNFPLKPSVIIGEKQQTQNLKSRVMNELMNEWINFFMNKLIKTSSAFGFISHQTRQLLAKYLRKQSRTQSYKKCRAYCHARKGLAHSTRMAAHSTVTSFLPHTLLRTRWV